MQQPNVPRVLHRCVARDLTFNMMETSFFVGRLNIVPIKNSRLGRILCQVFEVMHCNALTATRLAAMDFFRIPRTGSSNSAARPRAEPRRARLDEGTRLMNL
jgi:KUP system potassium uptake protein